MKGLHAWVLGMAAFAAACGSPPDAAAVHACGASICDPHELCVRQYVEDGPELEDAFQCVAEEDGQCGPSAKTDCPAQWGTGNLSWTGCVETANSVHVVPASQTLSCGYAFP